MSGWMSSVVTKRVSRAVTATPVVQNEWAQIRCCATVHFTQNTATSKLCDCKLCVWCSATAATASSPQGHWLLPLLCCPLLLLLLLQGLCLA